MQVLDVTHRRQMAQEGLSQVERTWSFAPDSQQGTEIATVPEEIDLNENELPGARPYHQNAVENV